MKLNKLAIGAFALSSVGALAAANTSSADSPQSSNPSYVSSQSSLQGDSSQVSRIQQALAGKGYNVGAVDGQMGPKTKSALKQFQQSQGLQASGQIDPQTVAALSITASASPSISQPSASQPSATEPSTSQPSTSPGTSGFSPQSPDTSSKAPS